MSEDAKVAQGSILTAVLNDANAIVTANKRGYPDLGDAEYCPMCRENRLILIYCKERKSLHCPICCEQFHQEALQNNFADFDLILIGILKRKGVIQ